jgi:hypothetical protein
VLAGCGDAPGSVPPRLTDDVEWAVRVGFSDRHVCTAAVLSEHWLLTAAHCVEQATNDHVVVTHEVFGQATVLYEGAAHLLYHPDYQPLGHVPHRWHDIALVGLRDDALEVASRARLCGLTATFGILMGRTQELYSVGYGNLPDPITGECGEVLGSKKRYDGFVLRVLTGPPFDNALGVELDGRRGALCNGDSGAPLLFDVDGVPHAFAVFSGEQNLRSIFHGTLIGPKIGWLGRATEEAGMPLDCVDTGGDSWSCFEPNGEARSVERDR